MQMFSTLAVYLRDFHSISEQGFGYMISVNAGMVVLFQFYVTRRFRDYPPLLLMLLGSVLYAVGFSAFGLTASYPLFMIATIIITIGEMIAVPTAQAVAAQMAPTDKRGRYMALYSYVWTIPGIVGPTLAGLVMDNADPRLVWYAGGIICLIAAAAFWALHQRTARQAQPTPAPAPTPEQAPVR
jgi:MFS family permease